MSSLVDSLYKVRKTDLPEAGRILASAFRNDPVWLKVFDGESNFDRKYRAFFETPVRYGLKYGEVYAPSSKLEGIIAWFPSHLADLTFWRMIRSGAVVPLMRIGMRVMMRMKPVAAILPRDRKQHMKGRTYLYGMIVGVSAEYEGQGYGIRIIRAFLEKSDQERVPVYVETETEENVRHYEELGFILLKKIVLPVIGLPMWEMVREPQ